MLSRKPTGKVLPSSEIFNTFTEVLTLARSEVVLVSPFITYQLFERCLTSVSDDVPITLITKWSAADIAGGFNDLRIWDLIRERKSSKLQLMWNLHAKYYRGDSDVLLGSGNLTRSGLNVGGRGNSEIMLKLPANFGGLSEFEENLVSNAVDPTEELYAGVLADVNRLKERKVVPQLQPEVGDVVAITVDSQWKPVLELPDILFEVYERRTKLVEKKSRQEAMRDLEYLEAPAGLNKIEFKSFVRNVLGQSPLFARVLSEIRSGVDINNEMGFSLVREIFGEMIKEDDVKGTWFASQEWLAFFYDDLFSIHRPL